MIEPNFPEFQNRPEETVINVTENLFVDKQTLFNKLQYPLSNIECQQEVTKKICRQLVSEEIFDSVVVNKYISGDGNFGGLVWEFRNEDRENFLRFLGMLKNLDDYPVTRRKFRKVINKVMRENFAALEYNFELNPSQTVDREENKVLRTHNADLLNHTNKDEEKETFLKTEETMTLNSDVESKSKSICSAKQKALIVTLVTLGTILLLGVLVSMKLKQNNMHIGSYNTTTIMSTTGKPFNTTEEKLLEITTVDPKTVESKVNESFYSYNFL